MSIWPATLGVKAASKLMSSFSTTGVLVNATALTLLLESSAAKSDSVMAS